MGYTRYWWAGNPALSPPTQAQWDEALADCARLVDAASDRGIELCREGNSATMFGFKGARDGHETFVIPRDISQLEASFSGTCGWFCKTARKPYDLVVAACLFRLRDTGGLVSESDGDNDDEQAAAWASEVLGRPISAELS